MADKHLLEKELEQFLSDAAATAVAEELPGLGQYDFGVCHTRFLRPKPDAHRMYVQDQVVIHAVRK
jgi:Glu-tRNA(Gln) amidotransferase subunit E-like FAD-binding protein